ncbi:MAG TPA: DUF2752 domain-containing protein [Phnomibacter sp.]|nr:DUF2752 domain-containing protein [Phnomibacter sp.]
MSLASVKWINWVWLAALFLFPVFLWLLPASYFDEGATVCVSQLLFKIECWGCGLTRAVMHLHHFELADALYYNILVVAVYPMLVLLWFTWVKAAMKRLHIWPIKKEVA